MSKGSLTSSESGLEPTPVGSYMWKTTGYEPDPICCAHSRVSLEARGSSEPFPEIPVVNREKDRTKRKHHNFFFS